MLVAAALVPTTGLLVPGAAGAATVLEAERAAALAAVRAVLARGPERVVVLRERGTDADLAGAPVGSLLAAGVPDDAWLPGPRTGEAAVGDVPATVALWLLAAAGWDGQVLVRGVDGRVPEDLARETGMTGTGAPRVAALLVGGGSVRRGPDAPLADDPRAAEVDAALVAWLGALGAGAGAGGGGDAGRGPDADVPACPEPAADDVTWHHLDAVAPARILAAALPGTGLGRPDVAVTVPLGATLLVATWLPDGASDGVSDGAHDRAHDGAHDGAAGAGA